MVTHPKAVAAAHCMIILSCLSRSALGTAPADKLESIDKEYLMAHYTKYEHMIPMRDGVRLLTSVYTPKDISEPYPLLLKRTPYSIRPYGVDNYPNPSGPMSGYGREKFIFVYQDVRGRNGSEGEFVHMRPHTSIEGTVQTFPFRRHTTLIMTYLPA